MARGSIRQRGPSSFQIRAYGGDGHVVSETVRGSRADADRRLRQMLVDIEEGARRGGSRTVGQLLEEWVAAQGPSWSPSTLTMTRGHIENYLGPAFGTVKLSKLEPARIDRFYGDLARSGKRGAPLAPSYIRRIHGTLHLALEQAVAWGWLARNPAARASPPPARRGALVPPDADQVMLLLDEAMKTNPALGAYLWLAAAAGPRRGEVAGLRRSDIDFESGAVTFRRVIVHAGVGDVIVKPYPKSRIARRIALDSDTVAVITDHLDWLGKRAAACGTELDPDPWVFSHDLRANLPPRPDAFTRAFGRLRDRLGLTVRLHDLRHAHATELLTAGVDVRTVAGRLGHASATTTLSIYAGWVPAADRAAADISRGLRQRIVKNSDPNDRQDRSETTPRSK